MSDKAFSEKLAGAINDFDKYVHPSSSSGNGSSSSYYYSEYYKGNDHQNDFDDHAYDDDGRH